MRLIRKRASFNSRLTNLTLHDLHAPNGATLYGKSPAILSGSPPAVVLFVGEAFGSFFSAAGQAAASFVSTITGWAFTAAGAAVAAFTSGSISEGALSSVATSTPTFDSTFSIGAFTAAGVGATSIVGSYAGWPATMEGTATATFLSIATAASTAGMSGASEVSFTGYGDTGIVYSGAMSSTGAASSAIVGSGVDDSFFGRFFGNGYFNLNYFR